MDDEVDDEQARDGDPLLDAIDAERRRLAREFHDGLGQALTGISLMSSAFSGTQGDTGAQLATLAGEAVARTRGLSQSLTPSTADGTLAALLSTLADDLQRRFQYPVSLSQAQLPAIVIPAGACRHLHHAIVDAVRYVTLHKGLSALALAVDEAADAGSIDICVGARLAEDGEPTATAEAPPCLELLRRRLAQLHGEVLFEPAPGALTVRLRCPRPLADA